MRKILLISFVFVLVLGSGATGAFLYAQKRIDQRLAAQEAINNAKKEDVAVTIIEGKRREEIALALDEKGICDAEAFLTASEGYEGRLFPDTYRFFPETPAAEVVAAMVRNFANRVGTGITVTQEQLVLASIVEREAVTDAERPLIAGVYANRIAIGMKLDADPTVQYGRDQNLLNAGTPLSSVAFWQPITQADYQNVKSPFNTYLNAAPPPSPISNPGLASIQAALAPTDHDYLYFLHKNGSIFFAKTLAEHIRNQ